MTLFVPPDPRISVVSLFEQIASHGRGKCRVQKIPQLASAAVCQCHEFFLFGDLESLTSPCEQLLYNGSYSAVQLVDCDFATFASFLVI